MEGRIIRDRETGKRKIFTKHQWRTLCAVESCSKIARKGGYCHTQGHGGTPAKSSADAGTAAVDPGTPANEPTDAVAAAITGNPSSEKSTPAAVIANTPDTTSLLAAATASDATGSGKLKRAKIKIYRQCWVPGCLSQKSRANAQLPPEEQAHFFSFRFTYASNDLVPSWSRALQQFSKRPPTRSHCICHHHFHPAFLKRSSTSGGRRGEPLSKWKLFKGAVPFTEPDPVDLPASPTRSATPADTNMHPSAFESILANLNSVTLPDGWSCIISPSNNRRIVFMDSNAPGTPAFKVAHLGEEGISDLFIRGKSMPPHVVSGILPRLPPDYSVPDVEEFIRCLHSLPVCQNTISAESVASCQGLIRSRQSFCAPCAQLRRCSARNEKRWSKRKLTASRTNEAADEPSPA
ncbi:uncharacterized protein LOC129582507 isoform X2 [Paramacrobiotus metropolitanus]|uniref:uncharacterized protein LOC129582507 isoform X2 n=1 Tax=Paramacrobiotus metropolitanus TaxID=2943436 RepID=UPI0024459053|nr:uncharacterized protein LOC129582507 isoform X2 [Paramacrobiotus metropolitanus]